MTSKKQSLFTASNSMRLFMFNSSLFMLLGIWLSGYDQVHWFSYFVPIAFIFAAITGFCIGLVIPRFIFNRN